MVGDKLFPDFFSFLFSGPGYMAWASTYVVLWVLTAYEGQAAGKSCLLSILDPTISPSHLPGVVTHGQVARESQI